MKSTLTKLRSFGIFAASRVASQPTETQVSLAFGPSTFFSQEFGFMGKGDHRQKNDKKNKKVKKDSKSTTAKMPKK